MLVSSKVLYDSFIQLDTLNTKNKIFKELPNYIYMAEHTGIQKDGKEIKVKGVGIVIDRKFVTCQHIPDKIKFKEVRTPLGDVTYTRDIKETFCKVKGKELEILVQDTEKDIFIADASPYNSLENFPCKPSSKRELGDKVYIIGNPGLTGTNIRNGIISDLDNLKGIDLSKYTFGTNISVIPGDSGSPLVNEDYKLIGIGKMYFEELGYFTKIEEVMKYINLESKWIKRSIPK